MTDNFTLGSTTITDTINGTTLVNSSGIKIDKTNIIVNQTSGGGFPVPVTVFFTMGESLIALTTVLGNGLVLYVIAKHTNLRTFTNYFIASLAAADLLVGAIGIPCSIVAFYGLPPGFWGCLFMNTVIIILTQISIFGLVTISLERYIAIQYPFFYEKHCHGTSATIIISVTWAAAILVGFVPVFGWNMKATYEEEYCYFTGVVDMDYMVFFNFFGFVLGPLLIMFAVYCYMFHTVRKQLIKIASLEVSVHRGSTSHPEQESSSHYMEETSNTIVSTNTRCSIQTQNTSSKRNSIRESFKRELRAAKWFAFVICLFAVCWLPLHIMNSVTRLSSPVPAPWVITAILLSHLNSAVNPVLYAYSNTKFKTAMRKALRCQHESPTLDFSRSGNNFTHSVNANNHSHLLQVNTSNHSQQPNHSAIQNNIKRTDNIQHTLNGKHQLEIPDYVNGSPDLCHSEVSISKTGYVNKAMTQSS